MNPRKYRHDDASTSAPETAGDPPYTKTGGIVAPKFGSATSGGAEFEPLPDDKQDSRR
jgi:hypothetical protein